MAFFLYKYSALVESICKWKYLVCPHCHLCLAVDLNIKQLFCSLWTISSNTHPPFTSLLRELLMGMSQHSSPFFPNYLICSIGFIEKGEEGKQKVSGKLK